MLNMNAIFEKFVTTLVTNALNSTRLQASTQVTLKAVVVDESTGRTYSTIRPDMIITEAASRRRVPVDIKYKLYDAKKLASGDVYQLFTYAYALAGSVGHRRAGLIYAAHSPTSGPNLRITSKADVTPAQICATGLDVEAVLDQIAAGSITAVHDSVRCMVEELTGLSVAEDAEW